MNKIITHLFRINDWKRRHNMWGFKFFGYELYDVYYNFIIYSIFGWIYESCYVSVKTGNLVNRGFLNGPIIPIYGIGATIVMIVFSPFKNQVFFIYLGGMILATVLEYVTSYLMEKIFHAKWWDYSDSKYNINGRICLLSSLFWGFLSVLMIEVLKPFSDTLIENIPRNSGEIIAYIILIMIICDMAVTFIFTMQLDEKLTILHKLREEFREYIVSTKIYEAKEELIGRYTESQISDIIEKFKNKIEDNLERIETLELKEKTEEIYERLKLFTNQYQKILGYKNLIHLRILKAFPNFKVMNKEGALKDLKARLHIKIKRKK